MSESFIKLIRSDKMRGLIREHPNAFILLTIIADRVQWQDDPIKGLKSGECRIGDWENIGLTRQQYRTALNILVSKDFLKILETCRDRKKSTTGSTTKGTKVKLLDSSIYDTNLEDANHRTNHRPTTDQPPTNHVLESRRISISNDIDKEIAQPAARLRPKDILVFNFTLLQFEGITDIDRASWQTIYPHIDINAETLKATEWLKSNPTKSHKKQWRKFLTGWFGRSNDSKENKKAFQKAGGGQSVDRRTKDIDGNPVENQYKGRF